MCTGSYLYSFYLPLCCRSIFPAYVADSLHSSPVVVTYESNPDTDVRKRALFIANNMGVLHAIDPEDGTELWSYTPEELLPNIKAYVDNKNTTKHIYGLDGQSYLTQPAFKTRMALW